MSGRKEEVGEKLTEPFEYFAFIEKPFDQKQLFGAIKEAMSKAKKHRPPVADSSSPAGATATAADSSAMANEIKALNAKIAKMQTEIDGLKKQLNQIVGFIKKKLG